MTHREFSDVAGSGREAGIAASIVQRHLPWLLAFALTLDSDRSPDRAEDVASIAITALCRHDPPIEDDSRQRAWLCRCVQNRAIDEARRRKAHPTARFDEARDLVVADRGDGDSEAKTELRRRVAEHVERLQPQLRKVVRARYFDKKQVRVIAAQFHMTEKSMSRRIVVALKRLGRDLMHDRDASVLLAELGYAPPQTLTR